MAKRIKVARKARKALDERKGNEYLTPKQKKLVGEYVRSITSGLYQYGEEDLKSATLSVIDLLDDYGFDPDDLRTEVYYTLKDNGYL